MQDKKPRVALDSYILAQGVKTGIYRVCDEIFRRLQTMPNFETYLFVRDGFESGTRQYLSAGGVDMPAHGHYCRSLPSADAEIFLSPFGVAPPQWLADRNVLQAHIVHDLIPIHQPAYFGAETVREVESVVASLDKRTVIFAVSESTKKDLLAQRPDLSAAQITVMPLAAGAQFAPCHDPVKKARVRERYGIPAGVRFVLSLATLEIRKNLDQVVNAFVQLLSEDASCDLHLVLAGMSGWKLDKLNDALAAAGEWRHRIVLTGFIEDGDLAALYSDALCFVYLSRYEGFGLPPLEAMACGTPVICADNSSLPEVVGDAGVMLDADDVDGVVRAMRMMASSDRYRSELASKGVRRAHLFSWDRTAEIISGTLAAAFARHLTTEIDFSRQSGSLPASADSAARGVERRLRSYARRAMKGVWWLATPWHMRQRLAFMRNRAAEQEKSAELSILIEQERARIALWQRGMRVPAPAILDLFNDASVVEAAKLPLSTILWAPVAAADVVDHWTAVRFLLDLWRRSPDLRGRFPGALSEGGGDDLSAWLEQEGTVELGLAPDAARHLAAALQANPSARARQAFLAHDVLSAVLPHGLTPAGARGLFGWFFRRGTVEADLRPEEIWWLFLEADQDPVRELMLAHSFSRTWQQRHPDGMTMFGRASFSTWFAEAYGVAGSWVDFKTWPQWEPPAAQIRTSYWARGAWRVACPDALDDDKGARKLLAWLSSGEAGLHEAAHEWLVGLDVSATALELARVGANVIAHFCYPSGLRVSAESMVQAMDIVGVSTSLRDLQTDAKDDPHHVNFRGMESHDVTILHTQPEPFLHAAYERAQLFERNPRTYRIAYWYWEFDSIPDSWISFAQTVDEVWAATEFVARGLRARLPVPVRTLFPGVKLAACERRGKSHFGLRETSFMFLFTFHMMSVMERKNPLGLIHAFRKAFREEDAVQLVLKTSFGDRHPEQFRALREAAMGSNIVLIDQVYSPDEVLSLMECCDAYVSLHRSEGLGLTMAEAMLMGKPVIATNFSGNVDFMNDDNSLLVPYELVKLGKPIPPYDADLEWAEPSIDEAARLMRRVYEDQAWAREIGARAKASAERQLSLEAAGRRLRERLDEIRTLRRSQR